MKILKYILNPLAEFLELPAGAIPISVHNQREEICVWALVPPVTEVKFGRRIVAYATGEAVRPCNDDSESFLGTVLLEQGSLVFHIFEL